MTSEACLLARERLWPGWIWTLVSRLSGDRVSIISRQIYVETHDVVIILRSLK